MDFSGLIAYAIAFAKQASLIVKILIAIALGLIVFVFVYFVATIFLWFASLPIEGLIGILAVVMLLVYKFFTKKEGTK